MTKQEAHAVIARINAGPNYSTVPGYMAKVCRDWNTAMKIIHADCPECLKVKKYRAHYGMPPLD